jgi:hypothetical protein
MKVRIRGEKYLENRKELEEANDASIDKVVSEKLTMFVPKRQQNKRKDFLKSSIELF